jgi:hypothetical protein
VATRWEAKKQEAAAAAKQRTAIRGVTGTVTEVGVELLTQSAMQSGGVAAKAAKGFNVAAILGTAIELAGAAGIAAWQAIKGKREATQKRRKTRSQQQSQEGIDGILAIIDETGSIVVQDHGIDPTTADFEKILYDNLYKEIGYTGNCNITAHSNANSPVLFKVSGNGRIFKNILLPEVPSNIQTYWRVQCKSMKDRWANLYQDMLIQQGRVRELEEFQASYNKSKKIIRVSFGIIFAILIIIAIRYGVKIR